MAVVFGCFFAAIAAFALVAPWVSLWRYQRFAAGSVRVGAHVVDVEVEKTWTTEEYIYEYHAKVAFVAEDGREMVVPLDFPRSIDTGAEVWLLHDREHPDQVRLEEKAGSAQRAVVSSTIGAVLAGAMAYVMFQIGGVVPEILPLD